MLGLCPKIVVLHIFRTVRYGGLGCRLHRECLRPECAQRVRVQNVASSHYSERVFGGLAHRRCRREVIDFVLNTVRAD